MSSEHRLHPYSVIFAFVAQIRVFIVPGIFVYFGIGSRDSEWWQPWMMLFVLPTAGVAVVRYLTYRFRYDERELVIQTGLLFRKERHIPYARIQNIDAVQNLFHRLLNVVEIRIETGSGQSAEATMSVLPRSALDVMRQRVFAERHAVAVNTGSDAASTDAAGLPASEQGRTLLQLDLRELILCGFIENRGAVIIATGFGLLWEVGVLDQVIAPMIDQPAAGRGALRSVLRGLFSDTGVLWNRIGLTLAAFAGLLVVVRLLSMAWAVIRLYGFRLVLVEGDARTEFGLLTRVAMTIPLRRVQALTVRESPLHRLTSRVAVKVDTAGGHAGEQRQQGEREYLAPILRREALDDFVQSIAGITLSGLQWRAPDARAFRREVKGWLIPAALACAALTFYLREYVLVIVPFALAWAIIGARQTVRHLGWAITDDAVMYKSGWLWRRVIVVRFAKIQAVTRYESPFDRRWQMARVHVDTAGASLTSAMRIPYVSDADASTLYEQLSREAAQRQFTW